MKSWNSRRALVAAAFGVTLLAVAGSALGAGGKKPARAKIVIKGGDSFKPNAYIKNTFHFVPGTVSIRSGGTVTLTNTTAEPHSLSILKRSQLVDVVTNPQGRAYLERDVRDVAGWFGSHGLPTDEADAGALVELLLAEAGRGGATRRAAPG